MPFSEFVRNVVLVFAALVGVWLAWKRVTAANRQSDAALRQATLARRAHVAELFTKAVEQLVSDKLELRLGAIFILQQIADDFPDLSAPTVQLLSAYLREHKIEYVDDAPPADVAAIIEILKERVGRA